MDQEGFLKDDQIYFCKFLSYRELWCINLHVLCETNLMVWSKLLIHIIIGVKKILHGSGRVPEGWPDLLLSNFELHRSLIYQFVCTLQDQYNSVITITYGHHLWNQESPPWFKKGSWKISRSTVVNFLATEKCSISICM